MQTDGFKVARPHLVRGVLAALIAIAAAVAASILGQLKDERIQGVVMDAANRTEKLFAVAGAVVILVAGTIAVRSFATAIRKAADANDAEARGGALAFVASVIGYLIVILATVGVFGVDLKGLLLGGALTGVVVGIAAQQTLGNFFAGIVLLAVRPFNLGEDVVLRGALGEYAGRITDMTIFYVHMVTAQGPVALPNAGVLACAIGPGARSKPEEPQPDAAPEGDPTTPGKEA